LGIQSDTHYTFVDPGLFKSYNLHGSKAFENCEKFFVGIISVSGAPDNSFPFDLSQYRFSLDLFYTTACITTRKRFSIFACKKGVPGFLDSFF
jgi:hypothetical protein